MRRTAIVSALVAIPLAALLYWIANNTYWADVKVPTPLKGEALVNPFYAAQRFAEALGARTAWDRVFTLLSRESVIVLSGWNWSLSRARRDALKRWVESGGRLVVDRTLMSGDDDFERWSGITRELDESRLKDEEDEGEKEVEVKEDECRMFDEERDGVPASGADVPRYKLCNVLVLFRLRSRSTPTWALREPSGIHGARVNVGRGSVTVLNASPFRYRNLFDGDHGALFVAATQLRGGDEVHFLSEEDHPSLLALTWKHGAPVVILFLAMVGLMLWRGSVRFGPLAAATPAARRSLAEQIRGTGQFALRHGGGDSLHAAMLRALDEAAQRRVPGYARLSGDERAEAVGRFSGFDADAIAAAMHHPQSRRSQELRNTIALLEAARRHTLVEHKRRSHGTH